MIKVGSKLKDTIWNDIWVVTEVNGLELQVQDEYGYANKIVWKDDIGEDKRYQQEFTEVDILQKQFDEMQKYITKLEAENKKLKSKLNKIKDLL